ncbi:low molecular weight protein-tyrosine-phosphatase [Cellulomonas sp. URHE0023]|uniref:low molecular weight protein-tyrosine-phosphatase n=1 Tax=Cellulomonas sp. URHE0023 TaxID=1380354 RepID=UPI00350FBD29
MPYAVMVVCTGNICRSPMAEVVLRDRFAKAGLAGQVVVDSSGISDEEHGRPIDRRARAVLLAHGYDPADGHRARQARASDLPSHDLVLAMTSAHARALRRLGDGDVRMYRSFDPDAPVGRAEHTLDVDDPWYGDSTDFEACLAQVEAAADGVVAFVRKAL